MRKIKFRTWHKKYKKIYDVSDLHMETILNGGIWATANGYNCIEDKDIKIQIQPNEVIIMQHTELKDMNGKEMYEGDIIIGNSYGDYPLIIKWDKEYTGFYCHDPKGTWEDHLNMKEAVNGKVIGNIYENPELLK